MLQGIYFAKTLAIWMNEVYLKLPGQISNPEVREEVQSHL